MTRTLDTVVGIKDRHSPELLAVDGVQGVGVSERAGQLLIKVYVANNLDALRAAIPRELDDVPVELEASGTFTAY